jgi:orotidine-5'-phosphate decarboxylase
LRLVRLLAPQISTFKVGLQLYTAAGPDLVRAILDTGANVFLDLKLHDIPNTVGRAVESANALGVQMLTIHLSGGRAMIAAAVAARSDSLILLGVTVLTSMDQSTLREIGVDTGLQTHSLKLVVPGVRPAGADAADQKRVMTPADTLHAGADCLVIGRPITADPQPLEAVIRICQQISA